MILGCSFAFGPKLDTTIADVFSEPHPIVVGGVDLFNSLAT
jgi:hypothetical protein